MRRLVAVMGWFGASLLLMVAHASAQNTSAPPSAPASSAPTTGRSSTELTVQLVQRGTQSTDPRARASAARFGRALLRQGRVADADADAVRRSIEATQSDLARIWFRGQFVQPVSLDGEPLDQATLTDPVDVVPGVHRLRIGWLQRSVHAERARLTVVDPPPMDARPAVYDWSAKQPYWPTAKIVTEASLITCAATGFAAAIAFVALAEGDHETSSQPWRSVDAHDRAVHDEKREHVYALAGLGVGSLCTVGAVLVPLFWLNPRKTAPRAALTLTPAGVQGQF